MYEPRLSVNSFCGLRRCSDGCAAPPPWKRGCSRFNQARYVAERKQTVHSSIPLSACGSWSRRSPQQSEPNAEAAQVKINAEIAARFLALNRFDNGAFERLNRYETALWRQVGQLLVTLEFLRRNQRL